MMLAMNIKGIEKKKKIGSDRTKTMGVPMIEKFATFAQAIPQAVSSMPIVMYTIK